MMILGGVDLWRLCTSNRSRVCSQRTLRALVRTNKAGHRPRQEAQAGDILGRALYVSLALPVNSIVQSQFNIRGLTVGSAEESWLLEQYMPMLTAALGSRALYLQLVLLPGSGPGHLHMECRLLQRLGKTDKSGIQSGSGNPGLAPLACVDQISIRGAEAAARVARPTALSQGKFFRFKGHAALAETGLHHLWTGLGEARCASKPAAAGLESSGPRCFSRLTRGYAFSRRQGISNRVDWAPFGQLCKTGPRDDGIRT